MGALRLENVTKRFGEVTAVDDVSLEIEDGEFMVLVGPSGCGKTTVLRMIAGLERATEGRIFIGQRNVTNVPAKDRDIAMVFQDYALYPHMTVAENIGFGLRIRKTAKPERQRRVEEIARVLGLESLLRRKPAQLSGGQRQRVAMGRAMVREPQAFLMDEPLSNLDAKLRLQMRAELAGLRNRLQTTTVFVTHDQIEAMTLGDRVAVIRDGVLQQVDEPTNLFWRPANLFVGAFIGSPAMNLVEATVNDPGHVSFAGFRLPLPHRPELAERVRETVIIGIRPSAFVHGGEAATLPEIEVVPEIVEELGDETHVIFAVDAPRVSSEELRAASEEDADDSLILGGGEATEKCAFTARIGPAADARTGEPLRLGIDTSVLYVFDSQTGQTVSLPAHAAPARSVGASVPPS